MKELRVHSEWLKYMAMQDPLREETGELVSKCQGQIEMALEVVIPGSFFTFAAEMRFDEPVEEVFEVATFHK